MTRDERLGFNELLSKTIMKCLNDGLNLGYNQEHHTLSDTIKVMNERQKEALYILNTYLDDSVERT
jgi:hypothetical protein